MSLVEPEVVLLVDQVSILTSSAESPKESSQMPERPLPLNPGGGFAKCEIDGKCALERRLGIVFCGLAKAVAEGCVIGDSMFMSPGKG